MASVSLDKLNLNLAKPAEALEDGPSMVGGMQVVGEVGKSSTAILELPSGYLDESGVLHREIVLREMDGRDEDILSNQKISMQSRMNKLTENCIQSIGPYSKSDTRWSDIVLSLPVIDRLWIVLQIRILTVGNIFTAQVKCPNDECGKYSQQNVDLNDFAVTGLAEPDKRSYSGVLPRSNKPYVCKIFTGADEGKLAKVAQKNKDDLMSLAIASRLLSLDGKSAPIGLDALKSLSVLDRQHLRNAFKKHEGEIDRKMVCTCRFCDTEFEESIDLDTANFFFPSEA